MNCEACESFIEQVSAFAALRARDRGPAQPAPATCRLTFWPRDVAERDPHSIRALALVLCERHRAAFARNWLANGGDMALVETETL